MISIPIFVKERYINKLYMTTPNFGKLKRSSVISHFDIRQKICIVIITPWCSSYHYCTISFKYLNLNLEYLSGRFLLAACGRFLIVKTLGDAPGWK